MTTPLVFKAFNIIQKLNNYSYSYVIKWNPLERSLLHVTQFKKLIPWHIANISVVFLMHFCLPIYLLLHRKTTWGTSKTDKDLLQIGAQSMIACHATACYGINIAVSLHGNDFVRAFNALLRLESKVRGRYISSREVKSASMLKELKPSKLLNQEADVLGLCMLTIIHILTVIPAVTPFSLVMEDMDPVGVYIQKILFSNFASFSWLIRLPIASLRIFIVTVAMFEISQTFRTIFNFGLSVFHIYRKVIEVPTLSSWKGEVIEVSHRILPIHIYVGIPGATAMAYFLLFATLPCAINCHEETQRLILVWYRQVASTDAASLRRLKKVLKKLRPLSFYCGSTGLLTRNAKRIYMASVIDRTVNVLLWRNTL